MKRSDDWPGKAEPRIVCAANLYVGKFGYILIVGPRHNDSTMRRHIAELGLVKSTCDTVTQGFIDQFGDFWNRQEAWKIAEKNGQIYRRCGGDTAEGGTLYSENLY